MWNWGWEEGLTTKRYKGNLGGYVVNILYLDYVFVSAFYST